VAVNHFERFVACSLGVPIFQRDRFSRLTQHFVKQDGRGAFSDAAFLCEQGDVDAWRDSGFRVWMTLSSIAIRFGTAMA
jgi:hypothetical protein